MAANSFREDEQMSNTDRKKIFVRMIRYLRPHIAEIIPVFISLIVTVGISLRVEFYSKTKRSSKKSKKRLFFSKKKGIFNTQGCRAIALRIK